MDGVDEKGEDEDVDKSFWRLLLPLRDSRRPPPVIAGVGRRQGAGEAAGGVIDSELVIGSLPPSFFVW